MKHTCPVCDKWVPKMHIKSHAQAHKNIPMTLKVKEAFGRWLSKWNIVL
jgi:hypothetical protein